MNDKLELRPSDLHGMGIFLARDRTCAQGELLFVAGGPVLTLREEDQLPEPCADKPIEISETFSIGPRTPDELDRMPLHYVNHSCAPNAGWKGQLFLMAMRDIAAGEEVYYDYAMVMHSGGRRQFSIHCRCGTAQCRREVTSDDWRILALQRRYDGWFQWYLQEKLRAPLA